MKTPGTEGIYDLHVSHKFKAMVISELRSPARRGCTPTPVGNEGSGSAACNRPHSGLATI